MTLRTLRGAFCRVALAHQGSAWTATTQRRRYPTCQRGWLLWQPLRKPL